MVATTVTEDPADYFDVALAATHEAPVGVVQLDERRCVVGLDDVARRMFACTRDDIAGRPFSDLLADLAPVTDDPEGRRRFRRCDGRTFTAECIESRIEVAIGGSTRSQMLAIIRELSIERGLRDEVCALTRRLRTVLDLSPVAMWIVESERVTYANRAALDLFGARHAGDLLGRSLYDILHPQTRPALQAHVRLAAAGTQQLPTIAGRIVRHDGQARDVEIASAALPDHGRTVLQMVMTDVTQREAQLREQARHRAELRRLTASVVEAREEERRRIARELHDELGQRLTALKMELSSLGHGAAGAPADSVFADRVGGMLDMIDDTVAAVRRIAADLRPLMLDDLGLNAAIGSLARDAGRRLGLVVTVKLDAQDPVVESSTSIALYRMVQEALTNVGRHARASSASVSLQQSGDELVLEVRDDGCGFPARALQHEGRFGLLGIRERALMLGGRLEVDNPPGGGGRITVRLPHRQAARPPEGRVPSPGEDVPPRARRRVR